MAERHVSTIVAIFGVYAVADGAWAVAVGVYASARLIDTWPIWLEGVVSVHPFVPREILWELAAWGVMTGVLGLVELPGHPARDAAPCR